MAHVFMGMHEAMIADQTYASHHQQESQSLQNFATPDIYSTQAPDLKLIHRFVVKSIEKDESRLRLELSSPGQSPFVFKSTLTGTWTECRVSVGDVVNVFSKNFTAEEGFLVSDTGGFLVTNPDNLITCTAVASTLFCPRKSWLSAKFKGWGVGNKIMLIGTLVHELLQACCLEKRTKDHEIEETMRQMLTGPNILLSAYLNDMTEEQLLQEVSVYIPWIVQWMSKYVLSDNGGELHGDARKKLKILKFHDIEDNIWCHYHGTKGKVDFTVEVRIQDKDFRVKKSVLPMELKTGKSSFSPEHEAQSTLYSMMMHNRQFGECDSALLLYIKDGPKVKHVIPSDAHRIALIQRRNEQEFFSRQQVVGPEFKDSKHYCGSCDHLLDCSLMARNFEPDKLQSASAMPLLSDTVTGHLSPDEVSFFGDWVSKLYSKLWIPDTINDFWNESAQSRELQGLSLARMKILRKKKFTYTFVSCESGRDVSSVVKDWNMRDRVAISLDIQPEMKRHMFAILTGFVEKIEENQVTCTFDKSLQECLERQVFRIDRLARSATASLTNFNSLLRLMTNGDSIAHKLRQSVILKVKHEDKVPIQKSAAIIVKGRLRNASSKVKMAVTKCLICTHYCLLENSLETESEFSNFIATFLRIAIDLRLSVLITSTSVTVLDKTLLTLKSNDIPFLRLLRSSAEDSPLSSFCEEKLIAGCKSVSQIQKIYESTLIMGSSVNGIINHPYFEMKKQEFDLCIILQADQPLMTEALGPLFRCQRFILQRNTELQPSALSLFSHLQTDSNVLQF